VEEGHAVIRKAVLDVLGAHGVDAREVRLMPIEPPRAWGLSTNVCMQLGPQVAREEIELKTEGLGKKEAKQVAAQVSREVSEKLAEHLAEELQGLLEGEGEARLPYVAKVEAEGAYVNFYYDAPALAAHVVQMSLGKTYAALDADARAALLKDADAYGHGKPTGKRIMVEYAQPNTHKDFHVGHLRNASIGQAIANLLEYAGNDVLKATYIGDVGKHVAKAMFGNSKRNDPNFAFLFEEANKFADSEDKLSYLGACYKGANAAIREDSYHEDNQYIVPSELYAVEPDTTKKYVIAKSLIDYWLMVWENKD
jgi:arginyl-tRNA synthetase